MKPTSLTSRCLRRGISLIEGVLYLVIALAVVTGGLVLYQQASLSQKVTNTSRMLIGMTAETRSLLSHQKGFGTTRLDAYLIGSGVIPAENLALGEQDDTPEGEDLGSAFIQLASASSSKVITNPFGGRVRVDGSDEFFTVTLSSLPRSACARLAQVDLVGAGLAGSGIFAVSVSGEVIGAGNYPVSPVQAAQICHHGENTLSLGYLETGAPIHAASLGSAGGGAPGAGTGGSGDDPDFDYEIPTVYWPNEWGNYADWGETVTSKWIDTSSDEFFKAGADFRIWGDGNPRLEMEDHSYASEGTMSRWGTNIRLDPPPCGESEYIYIENADGEVGRLELSRPAWPEEWGAAPDSCS